MTINKIVAPAKINLNLHITGKDKNNYHLLSSLVCFTEFGDELDIKLRNDKQFNLKIIGDYTNSISNTDNLIIKGANLIAEQFDDFKGADIILNKKIPIASGIGGGSTDCATTIKTLLKLWNKQEPKNIEELLLSLGADIPVCYYTKAVIMQGIGQDLTPVNIPSFYMVLANPNIAISTKEVFKKFAQNPDIKNNISFKSTNNYNDFLKSITSSQNVLQKPAVEICNKILELLDNIADSGADAFAMSGSGATCYGIYPDKQSALNGFNKIDNKYWKTITRVKL